MPKKRGKKMSDKKITAPSNGWNMEIPAVFGPIFSNQKRFKLLFGGRGTGKSQTVARYIVAKACEGRKNICCCRQFYTAINDSIYELIIRVIRNSNLSDRFIEKKDEIINIKNGTRIFFRGLHAGNRAELEQRAKSLEEVDILWIEEAQTVPPETFKVLSPTIRNEHSEIICTLNRLGEFDGVWQEFCAEPQKTHNLYAEKYYEDENTIIIYATFEDNPFFPAALEIERQKCLKENPGDYDWIWLGYPQKDGGAYKQLFPVELVNEACARVISEYEVAKWPMILGIDPNDGGKDTACSAPRRGLKAYRINEYRLPKDPLIQANRFAADIREWKPLTTFCDRAFGQAVLAVCGGQLGFDITGVDFGASPTRDICRNKRAEIHYNLRQWLYDGGALPDDPLLRQELLAVEINLQASEGGAIALASKDRIRLKIGRSPGRSDALALTFAMPVASPEQSARQMQTLHNLRDEVKNYDRYAARFNR
jgi:phage terminase large subunit